MCRVGAGGRGGDQHRRGDRGGEERLSSSALPSGLSADWRRDPLTGAAGRATSAEPGREERLDLPAAARFLELRPDLLRLDDDERGQLDDAEALGEVGPLLVVDAVERERPVVAAALEDLREEALDAAAVPGQVRVEEDEPGLRCPRGNAHPDVQLPGATRSEPVDTLTFVRRVAVTGLGAVTPIGNDVATSLGGALAGRSGVDWIQTFDASAFPVRVAAEVKEFDPTTVASPKEVRKLERYVLLSLGAAKEAVADAGIELRHRPGPGSSSARPIGGLPGILEQADVLRERGLDRVSPNFLPNVLVDSASGQLAISLGIRGPNYAVVSACATGSHAVGEGAELIKRGDADVVLAGGTESCMHPLILAGFCAMRGLAAEEEHPPRASRPFDETRAGFVMGEGRLRARARGPRGGGGARRRTSTPRWSATAPRTTRTTWPSRTRSRRASSR